MEMSPLDQEDFLFDDNDPVNGLNEDDASVFTSLDFFELDRRIKEDTKTLQETKSG